MYTKHQLIYTVTIIIIVSYSNVKHRTYIIMIIIIIIWYMFTFATRANCEHAIRVSVDEQITILLRFIIYTYYS